MTMFFAYELFKLFDNQWFLHKFHMKVNNLNAQFYINQFTVNHVHPKIRDIIKPTPFMEELISKHKHLVEGVCCGISVRRGSYSEDSRQFDSKESEDASHYFCSDEGLKKFQDVIEEAPGPVFVSSDSKSTLNMLIEKYGDKIRYFKTDFTVGAHQDFRETTMSDYHNIYLKFFLLSVCPPAFPYRWEG